MKIHFKEKNVVTEATKEEMQLFVDSINIEDFEQEIYDITGVRPSFEKEIRNISGKDCLYFVDDKDYSGKAGIFSKVLSSVKIETFNSSINVDKNGELYFAGSFVLTYVTLDGSENSVQILRANYVKDGWLFRRR